MITATDPRHGERAGYIAGCRQECCRPAHLYYQKRSTLRRHREGPQWVDPAPLITILNNWARYGITPTALAAAAGVSDSTICTVIRENTRVSLKTLRKVQAVTWNDLPDTALVYADLTRLRVYSLMAAGHTLTWITQNSTFNTISGKWREQTCTTLGVARSIQALYANAPITGTNKQCASKARGRGYPVPAAWDDPPTPAMPHGWKPTTIDPGWTNKPARHRAPITNAEQVPCPRCGIPRQCRPADRHKVCTDCAPLVRNVS